MENQFVPQWSSSPRGLAVQATAIVTKKRPDGKLVTRLRNRITGEPDSRIGSESNWSRPSTNFNAINPIISNQFWPAGFSNRCSSVPGQQRKAVLRKHTSITHTDTNSVES